MSGFRAMPATIDTERLLLRAWRDSDATDYRRLRLERDPRSPRLIGADGRPTESEFRDRIRVRIDEAVARGFGLFAVQRRDEVDFIGYCGLVPRDETPDEPELAYELLRQSQGGGYATEAAQAVLDAAVHSGRARRWAGVRTWNVPSFRVFDKTGLVPSGWVVHDADRGDLVMMTNRA